MRQVINLRIEERDQVSPLPFSKKSRPEVVLIVYDTAFIIQLQKRDTAINREIGSRWYVPSKYCLISQSGWDDDGIVAQVHAHDDLYMNNAVWFSCLRDLPVALLKLKEKFPDQTLPDQVDYIIDFPLKRLELEPGSTIVVPNPPKMKKPKYD